MADNFNRRLLERQAGVFSPQTRRARWLRQWSWLAGLTLVVAIVAGVAYWQFQRSKRRVSNSDQLPLTATRESAQSNTPSGLQTDAERTEHVLQPTKVPIKAAPELQGAHQRMVATLATLAKQALADNSYMGSALAVRLRGELSDTSSDQQFEQYIIHGRLASEELKLGNETAAIDHYRQAMQLFPKISKKLSRAEAELNIRNLLFYSAVAYLRWGESQNCCQRNTPDSCILPIQGEGVHQDDRGSRKAIQHLEKLLTTPGTTPDQLFLAKWLLNLAYMTVGEYPQEVPPKWLIQREAFASDRPIPRFTNVARQIGLDTFSLAGGAIGDDFDGDHDLDLLVSTWHPSEPIRFFRNTEHGQFLDESSEIGLAGITGGLNMIQADYDNDGDLDVYVLRGGWWGALGKVPNSLLQNQGDGSFLDVTYAAGLAVHDYPTQTACWADYDNDGDVDLYVGNEQVAGVIAPCQLFRNNGDRTFTDVASTAGVTNERFTKAVIWGDYDSDRWPDLYVSNLEGENRLYRNRGDGTFQDVAAKLGVARPLESFPAWFFDFDNDGHLDLYVSSYSAGAEDLGWVYSGGDPRGETQRLYRNNGQGGFDDVTEIMGLHRPTAPMGSNFGDLNNDGFLDIYLGTGSPPYFSLMPNVMYLNEQGRAFADVTTAGGFGSLQKGHAVVFADFDNDGDQDIFEQMGGAFLGDRFFDAYYVNPGFDQHWLRVRLVGVQSNRSAIGARIQVIAVEEEGNTGVKTRHIFKHVNSGGSFGANPLVQTIGLGNATRIKRIEVFWPTTGRTQVVNQVVLDTAIEIVEGGATN